MKSNLTSSESKSVHLPKSWPHVIRNGDVAVKIYKNKGHVRGENFPTFLLSYYASGKRQLRRFMDFDKANAEATRIAEQKAQGALGAAALSATDRVSLEQALSLLAKNEGIGNAILQPLNGFRRFFRLRQFQSAALIFGIVRVQLLGIAVGRVARAGGRAQFSCPPSLVSTACTGRTRTICAP